MVKLGFDAGPQVRLAIVAALVACGMAVVACESPMDVPVGAVQFIPPAVYQRWWTVTQQCAGRTSNFGAVRWYHVPGSHFSTNGKDVRGYYDPKENAIVLSDSLAVFGAGVRHEMLHAVLAMPGHPRDMYQGFCAGAVTCPTGCAMDGGKWQAPGPWTPMKAESLVVTASAQLMPQELDGDRWLVIRTRARNPLAKAVMAIMPPPPMMAPPPQTFSFALTAVSGGARVIDFMTPSDSSSFYFAPSETKEFVFELRVGDTFNRYTVPPGDYVFRGGFGAYSSAPATVNVMRLQAAGLRAAPDHP